MPEEGAIDLVPFDCQILCLVVFLPRDCCNHQGDLNYMVKVVDDLRYYHWVFLMLHSLLPIRCWNWTRMLDTGDAVHQSLVTAATDSEWRTLIKLP